MEINDTTKRLKFTGLIYNLEITPEKITLIAPESSAELAAWRYRQIKSYGKSSGKFNFECGRSAETGPGAFVFKTTCSKEIFGIVHRNIKQMKMKTEQQAQKRQSQQVSPLAKTDFRTYNQQPLKPMQYKARKSAAQNMSVGTYRYVKET